MRSRADRPRANPADRVLRARVREPVRFPDLTERRALKLSAIPHYTAAAHFGLWHRRVGGADFSERTGLVTPLFYVELEATDRPITTVESLEVRGESYLAKTVDAAGGVDRLLREGRYEVLARDRGEVIVGRATLINVFTRFDPDPARRRVTALPPAMGLGVEPSRAATLPSMDSFFPDARRPDFIEPGTRVWHYGQTDPNGHVTGMEYLRVLECYVTDALQAAGHDARRLYYSRARIIYRKPCFRGEGYRRAVWFSGNTPPVVTGAFYKTDDQPDARPAVAVELTVSQHDRSGAGAIG